VQHEVREAFVERLIAAASRMAVDDPRRAGAFTGPVIGESASRRFEDAVRAARATAGTASVLTGGARLRGGDYDHGAYLAPTVLADLPAEHDLNRRELFLPVLSLQSFDRLDEAIADSNRSALGLSAGIYARDAQELEGFWDGIEAGVLYANRASGATTGAWPGFQTFCGWKGSGSSGKGGLGPHYVQQFMREQNRTTAPG